MKRVLVVCYNADHPRTGYASRVISNVAVLAAAGNCVSVLRLVPIFRAGESWRESLREVGVKNVAEVAALPISRYGFLRRLSPMFGWVIVLYFRLIWRATVVLAEGHEAAAPALFAKLFAKVAVDVHGAGPEEAEYARSRDGRSPTSMCDWLNHVERRIVFRADMILLVSQSMRSHLISKWRLTSGERMDIVPIYSRRPRRQKGARDAGKGELGFKFVYSGGMQSYQCVPAMLELFKRIVEVEPRAKLLILTPEVDVATRHVIDAFGGVPSFVRIDSAPQESVAEILPDYDAGFVLRESNILNKVSCPTKIGEYLEAGLIVICTASAGHAAEAASETGAAVVLRGDGHAEDISGLIEDLRRARLNYNPDRVARYLALFSSDRATMPLVEYIKNA